MSEFTRNAAVTIGLTVVQLSQRVNTGERVEFSIRNNSTGGQLISLFFSDLETATSGAGISLSAGQSITQSHDTGYKPWQGNMTAIADAAGGTVSIYERVVA